MKHLSIGILLLSAVLSTACDDGRIPEKAVDLTENGRVAKVDLTISGADSWPEGYIVAVAGFADNNAYARVTKDLIPDAEGHVSVTLKGIPDDVKQLEICAINSLRRRVATFWKMDAPTTKDTISIRPDTPIRTGMYSAIQSDVFTKQCANCHSGSAWAASLHLTEGKSYADLVNRPSVKMEGHLRVKPGDATASVLFDILSNEESKSWKFDHSNVMADEDNQVRLQVIRDWINSGAKE